MTCNDFEVAISYRFQFPLLIIAAHVFPLPDVVICVTDIQTSIAVFSANHIIFCYCGRIAVNRLQYPFLVIGIPTFPLADVGTINCAHAADIQTLVAVFIYYFVVAISSIC